MKKALVWEVLLDPDAAKELTKLDGAIQREILRFLREDIATPADPRRFGKPLRKGLKGLWRYRVADHRVICKVLDRHLIVVVVRVGPRDDVYDDEKLIARRAGRH